MGFNSDPQPVFVTRPQTPGEIEQPLFVTRPQTPGEVQRGLLDDEEVEVQRGPLDFMRHEVLTRGLLRDELKYFASHGLDEEFSKMRCLLQEDIQDALLRVQTRATCSISNETAPIGKTAQHLSVPRKVQWAAPRPPPAVTSETVSDIETIATLRMVGDPPASEAHNLSASRSRETESKISFEAFEHSAPGNSPGTHSTKFLLNGEEFLDAVRYEPRTSHPSINSPRTRNEPQQARRDSDSTKEVSTVQMQRDLKRMKFSYRRKAKKLQSTAHLPEAMGENTKLRVARCIEIFLEQGVAVIIVLNGIFIGVQADYQARNLTEAVPIIFPVVEISFFLIFFLELLARICINGKALFVGQGWRWNWFDLILVLFQLVEVGGMMFTDHESSAATPVANVSFLRLLRILRLFRVLRLVRLVEFIGELNTIISSIANSMRSLCWTLFLLLMMIYTVGILFTQAVFSQRVLMEKFDPASDALAKWWGNLYRSVLSLYQAIFGGVDWEDVTLPLTDHVSPLLTCLFCFYIAFTVLAMMNVVTGIFVETAIKNAEKEKDAEFTETANALFAQSDLDQSGQITWEEFVMQIDEPRFHFYMKSFGIDPTDAKLLFKLLDDDKSGTLDLEELLSGLIRLRAGAKFMDIMKIMHEIDRFFHSMESHEKPHAVKKKVSA